MPYSTSFHRYTQLKISVCKGKIKIIKESEKQQNGIRNGVRMDKYKSKPDLSIDRRIPGARSPWRLEYSSRNITTNAWPIKDKGGGRSFFLYPFLIFISFLLPYCFPISFIYTAYRLSSLPFLLFVEWVECEPTSYTCTRTLALMGLLYQARMMMMMVIGDCGVISGMRFGRRNRCH